MHQTLTEEIKNLHDRLIAAPHDKSGSWIGSKITRPSLDKLGGWLGGQLSNFVAGEADSPQSEDARGKERNFTGPFAHYSTISSTTSSTMPSPKISTTDLTEVAPPYRAGSALALRPPTQVQINRASSAMDYIRRKPSPVQRVSSANAISSPYSDPYSPQLVPNGFVNFVESSPKPPPSSATNGLTVPQPQEPDSVDTPLQGPRMGSWWGAPDSEAPTPTAATFIHTDTSAPSANGFVSLMDDPALSITPIATSKPPHAFGTTSSMSPHNELDDDELGLGNGAKRRSNSIQNGDIGGSNSTPIPEAKSNAESEKPGKLPLSISGPFIIVSFYLSGRIEIDSFEWMAK